MDNEAPFYHALNVIEELCTGCVHCMSVCPTAAIRVRDGKATIDKTACVDCGMCLKSCPNRAIFVEQDDFNQIFKFNHRIALLPSVLIGQFPEEITEEQIFHELHEMGFTYVFEVDQTVQLLSQVMQEYMIEHQYCKPLISSFCPAIVRLIQVRFPSLVGHIIKLKQAMDLAAIYARKKCRDMGIPDEDTGIFYVTQCAAKIAAIKAPVGEEKSSVDGVINMDFIYNKILLATKKHHGKEILPVPEQTYLSSGCVNWTLTNGEASKFSGTCLAIDEIHNVIEILEKIENDEISDIDFLELRACDHSCASGVLTTNNRFLTIERLHNRMKRYQQKQTRNIPDLDLYKDFIRSNVKITEEILPHSIEKLDEDMEIAMEKMEKVQRIMKILPGIDCGGCGSPSCLTLAQDVVREKAKLNQCVFLQKILCNEGMLTSKESLELSEKIWGKERFNR